MAKLGNLALNAILIFIILTPSQARRASLEPNLVARTRINGLAECWDALAELQSCTDEIILFFMNGEAYLGSICCQAVRIIMHKCWPSMLTSLGFTDGECDILKGYCDASAAPEVPLVSAEEPSMGRGFSGVVVSEDLVH